MTPLHKEISRLSVGVLDGTFCKDSGRKLVATLLPGDGEKRPDMIELRPYGTRRPERMALCDVYRLAVRARVNLVVLEKARNRKAVVAARRERQAIKAAEKRLFSQQ